ncbi:Uncharacterised protein [Mycobacteroides abscessus subsp. abscessus]|nr:Uncharacterised protein [Mycobacteroides abscessus subsp. abscessus]
MADCSRIELTGGESELERVQRQLRGNEWRQSDACAIQIHGRVQTAGLFVVDLCAPRQRRLIAWTSSVGEETKGVEVCAPQRHRFDDGFGGRGSEPQRDGMSGSVGAIDHRPLVQTEASQACGAGCSGVEQCAGGEKRTATFIQERGVDGHASVAGSGVAPQRRQFVEDTREVAAARCPRRRQQDAVPRVPSAYVRRACRVVGEQEVEDGVLLALRPRTQVWPDEIFDARLVLGAARLPGGGG